MTDNDFKRLHISLPRQVEAAARALARQDGYTLSGYIAALIRRDRDQKDIPAVVLSVDGTIGEGE